MKYRVTQDYPKSDLGVGCVSLGAVGMCLLLTKDGKLATRRLDRAHVELIHQFGIKISGFERLDNGDYKYQVWHCMYVEDQ